MRCVFKVKFTFRAVVMLVMIDLGITRYYSDSCRYQFNVWEPNGNMLSRMNELEVKYGNFSNYVDKELANYKLLWSFDVQRSQNWTYRLESLLGDLKVSHITGMTKVKDIQVQISNYLTKLDNVETTVNELALKNPTPRAIRKKHIRNDRTLSQSDSPHAVPFGMLKNMVGDLKSEWIVMKRELIQLRNEYGDLRRANERARNETLQVQLKSDKTRNEMTILKISQKRHSNDVSVIKTDVTRLKQDLAGSNAATESLRTDIARTESNVAELQTSTATIKKNVMNLQAENEFLKKQLLSTPRSSLSLENRQTRTLEKHSDNEESESSTEIPRDCADIVDMGYKTSGIYQIKPSDQLPLDNVYCEIVNNTGYTIVQRRTDGLQTFNRGWLQYKVGFGNQYGDFWIGNEFLHQSTKDNKYGLRVDIWDWEGNRTYAEYDVFTVSDEASRYTLHVAGYTGNAGDSLSYHDDMKFSTEDLDNDMHMRNCASENKGGWWFRSCYLSNLNGIYHTGWYQSDFADGIVWYTLKDSETYSLRKVEMKLKRRSQTKD